MKIVISYDSDGGCECGSYLNIHRVVYESCEAWIVHFEEALDRAVALKEEHREKKATYDIRNLKPYMEWVNNDPGNTFIFCGIEWYIDQFYSYKTKTKDLPEVLELNEWFESTQNGN